MDSATPLIRYDSLIKNGLLRDDSHQRSIVQKLEDLHDELRTYKQYIQPETEEEGSGGGWVRFICYQANTLLICLYTVFEAILTEERTREFGREAQNSRQCTERAVSIWRCGDRKEVGLHNFAQMHTLMPSWNSMLMDLFFDSLPPNITKKRRIHFHQFMIDAHKRMHSFKSLTHRPSGIVMSAASAAVAAAAGSSSKHSKNDSQMEETDPIPHVAREFAEEASVLCFDEFQVTDIADAMILRRLFEHMLWHGVVCVATSNRHPDELYKNGIQRSSFIPCIELLKEQLNVVNLDSGTDYRKLPRALTKVYFSPLTPENKIEMDKLWEALTTASGDEPVVNRSISIWGRNLVVPLSTQRCARFTFLELCGKARSAADYIELCRSFSTIFIDDIPRMNLHQRDLARRFITFIDAAYESKVRIFASSEVEMLKIFSGDVQEGPTKDAMRSLMDDLVSCTLPCLAL